MKVLGLNTGPHDAAAALIDDGRLISVAEEERYRRVKRAPGLPPVEAIAAILQAGGISLDDIDVIAVGWDLALYFRNERRAFDVRAWLSSVIPQDRFGRLKAPVIRFFPHHVAHAASAFWTSGLDDAAIIVVDGRGEQASTSLYYASDASGLRLLGDWGITESLGNYYGLAAEWAGLGELNPGKLMGLAAYGRPSDAPPVSVDADGFHFHGIGRPSPVMTHHYQQQREALRRHFSGMFPFAESTGGDVASYANFAATIQASLDTVVRWLAEMGLHYTRSGNLLLAGGVALNCTTNGALARAGIAAEMYVPPWPYDAGVAVGAAFLAVDAEQPGELQTHRVEHAYWAPAYSPADIRKAVTAAAAHGHPSREYTDDALARVVAERLAEGAIAGWWQGRGEVGQRSLGARSILADPRHRWNLHRVNRLKGREMWRPLAPSITDEYLSDIVSPPESALFDFMLAAAPVRESVRRLVPAVVHADGTARPHRVKRAHAPRLWGLLDAFHQAAGVPALINTSFNLAGEPIVSSPHDALDTFLRSDLDLLVLDRVVVTRAPRGGAS